MCQKYMLSHGTAKGMISLIINRLCLIYNDDFLEYLYTSLVTYKNGQINGFHFLFREPSFIIEISDYFSLKILIWVDYDLRFSFFLSENRELNRLKNETFWYTENGNYMKNERLFWIRRQEKTNSIIVSKYVSTCVIELNSKCSIANNSRL